MIHGMTGFSSKAFLFKGRRWVINIRSVNHKFLDCVITIPDELLVLDEKIKKELRTLLHRGRIVFQLISLDPPVRHLVLNKKLLTAYLNYIKNISRSLHIPMNITASDIVRLPEVISLRASGGHAHKGFSAVFTKAMRVALHKLLILRKKEGKAIYRDLRKRTQTTRRKLSMIEKRVKSIVAEKKQSLSSDELHEFLKDYNIQEEVDRLHFHIASFCATLMQAGSLGKVLDFIVQEMQREINTLSAKFRDARVSYLSVFIKDEIEKIREQLQNVE